MCQEIFDPIFSQLEPIQASDFDYALIFDHEVLIFWHGGVQDTSELKILGWMNLYFYT